MPKRENLSRRNIAAAFNEAGFYPAQLEVTPANGQGVKVQFEIDGVVACGHIGTMPDCAAARRRYISDFVKGRSRAFGHKKNQ